MILIPIALSLFCGLCGVLAFNESTTLHGLTWATTSLLAIAGIWTIYLN